jgi:chromosome segregation ATPase
MSDEALARIEQQLNQLMPLVPMVSAMQQDIITIKSDIVEMKSDIVEMKSDIVEIKGRVTTLEQNTAATREDLNTLRDRYNSLEGVIVVAIRAGFAAQQIQFDDLNYAIEENARKYRSLSRRIRRLERLSEDEE